MKQHYTDKRTGITYTLQGDHYLPDLALPEEMEQHIGVWEQQHLRYVRQHKKVEKPLEYAVMTSNGTLQAYCDTIWQNYLLNKANCDILCEPN